LYLFRISMPSSPAGLPDVLALRQDGFGFSI
jgi:hypothetical protein